MGDVSTATEQEEDDDTRAAIDAIWARSREGSLARVAVLEEAVAALIENRLSEEQRRDAEREAHRLAGSAGTFGFSRASEAARQLERTFAAGSSLALDRLLMAAEEVVALRADLEREPAADKVDKTPRSVPAPALGGGRRVTVRGLVVAVADEQVRNQMTTTAKAHGFQVTEVTDASQLATGDDTPVAALVDLGLPHDAGLHLLARLSQSQPPVPAFALMPAGQFCDRLEAARMGASSFLDLSASPIELINAVEELLKRRRTADSTVLVVDDDPSVLDAVEAILSTAGLSTVGLQDPSRFWTVLEEENPDLVVLDLDMPQVRGDELCRVVRSDAQWASLPILFLTAHSDADAVGAVFAAGADDFVAKPFGGPELLARVENRLERTRLLRAMAETDSLTGLANRRHSEHALQGLLNLAQRHRQPLSVALIDLDRFDQVNDDHGHAVGDTVLRHVGSLLGGPFRGEDVVARWGDGRFMVGVYGMSRDDAVQHIASVLETLREERFVTPCGRPLSMTFSAGVATYPDVGATVHDLCDVAGEALKQVKRAGGDRVLSSAAHRPEHDVDVVVVEDDPVLAELLGHALTTRGYRHQHLSDGRVAAEQLAGNPPALHGRVILLDVDLPVLSGFGVLRALAATGTLVDTKVIMLTARSSEAEILESLQLGAFDHVAKPFSVPVLLQRIRRALAS